MDLFGDLSLAKSFPHQDMRSGGLIGGRESTTFRDPDNGAATGAVRDMRTRRARLAQKNATKSGRVSVSFGRMLGVFRAFRDEMTLDGESLDALRERVIGCAIAVHRALGPGLLESIYRDCLAIELKASGLRVEQERCVCLHYRGERVGTALRIDLVVNGQLVVEIKAVERLHSVYSAQVITYLKLSGLPQGLLINFNLTTLRAGLKKLVHPNLYASRHADNADAVI